MGDQIMLVVAAFGGWAILAVAAAKWISDRVTQRLGERWTLDRELQIEQFRALSGHSQAVVSAALGGFSSSHSAANERRLGAVESLWKAMMGLRNNAPPAIVLADILSDKEFEQLAGRHDLINSDLTTDLQGEITKLMSMSASVEEHRPFCGELPWAIFFVYKAIHGRLLFLIDEGTRTGVFVPWRRDDGMRQLLSSVLTNEELSDVMQGSFGKWLSCLQLLESKFLREVESLISGKHASDAGLREATRIVATVQSVERHAKQQRL